ncbi:MAG: hypothetical protein NTW87_05100 [Planctomycetota bacterium]|nr:hypothetical protein [Planctomycetota bacterium]
MNPDDLATRIRAMLAATPPAQQRHAPQYENGVHTAVRAIESLL